MKQNKNEYKLKTASISVTTLYPLPTRQVTIEKISVDNYWGLFYVLL